MKSKLLKFLTLKEKIDMLNYYYLENKSTNLKNAELAKKIARIYEASIKVDCELEVKTCDKLLSSCAKIVRSRAVAPTDVEKKECPVLLAKILPQIIEFEPTVNMFGKVEMLRYDVKEKLQKQKERV